MLEAMMPEIIAIQEVTGAASANCKTCIASRSSRGHFPMEEDIRRHSIILTGLCFTSIVLILNNTYTSKQHGRKRKALKYLVLPFKIYLVFTFKIFGLPPFTPVRTSSLSLLYGPLSYFYVHTYLYVRLY